MMSSIQLKCPISFVSNALSSFNSHVQFICAMGVVVAAFLCTALTFPPKNYADASLPVLPATAAAATAPCHTQITVEVGIHFSPSASFQYPTRIASANEGENFFHQLGAKGRKNYSHPNRSIS